ncbi:saccharopine dehydrogenase NADP-binding domain-containing protein [Nonomuraea sp. NPDC046802]|uniref:saccharopine dehydrogenase NADP-binding domain-containing protein n=1 Tax=Nonomuraea sp. NPDC046802 TaxID=3154919 RepID=UPI0033DFEC37
MGRVAVVGAYGEVGACAVAELSGADLRVGGRDPHRTQALAARAGAEPMTVDVTDARSLAAFCAGSDVVLNCAGPALTVGTRVAEAAQAAGAAYVDAAGDDPLHAALSALPWAGSRPAVLSAGMMPGLSGLLPTLLGPCARLTGYVGGCDTFTPVAARDYLAATAGGYGRSGVAWRAGRTIALDTLRDARIPGFPGTVTAVPYLSTETERLAERLGAAEIDWYSVFTGPHVVAALSRGEDAAGLCAAAELDSFGRQRYQLMVFESGDGRRLVCRATGAGALTGAAAATAVIAVLDGLVPPGVWHLPQALDPQWAVSRIAAGPAVIGLHVLTGEAAEEEGTL